MAMKELLRVELDSKGVRRACEHWVRGMTKGPDAEYLASGIPDDLRVVVVLTKRRGRKAKAGNSAVASAGPLSDQETRFA